MTRVNLGCPRYCKGWVCVDLFPKDKEVVKMDALQYLRENQLLDVIKTENLLEHLPNVGEFLRLCYQSLEPQGRIDIITDNAEWLPFYLPLAVRKVGIGAHAKREYSLQFNAVHLSIFSKMHLHEHLVGANFWGVKVRRIRRVFGARIEGVGFKR